MEKKYLEQYALFKTDPHWTLLEFLSLFYCYDLELVQRHAQVEEFLYERPNCKLYERAILANVKPLGKKNGEYVYSPFDILEFLKKEGIPIRPELDFIKKPSDSGEIQYSWASDGINEPLKTNNNHIFQGEQITSWEALEIILTSLATVTIKTQNDTTKLSFNELGMAHKKNPGKPEKPKEVWQTLMLFAKLDGKYPNSDVPDARLENAKDRVKEFNKTLKKIFNLNKNIYKHHYKIKKCWETKFRISSRLEIHPKQEHNHIMDLNKKHAIITVGGKVLVLNETIDPIFKRPDFTLSTTFDFKTRYGNKKIPSPNNPKKIIGIADSWLSSPERREHLGGIIFDPSATPDPRYYNLWKGFAVEPKEGDWQLFKNHISTIIADGKPSRFKWIMAWLARILQDPGGERPGTALVLRGKQGTGKGIFVNTFGAILGKHFIQIAQASQVTGRFNNHFKDVLLAFVDEGFWAGDKQAEGAIKNIITEPFITVEQKGKDIIRVKNNVNLVMASNSDWVVPAGLEERRFFVIDISDARQQDHKYFRDIVDQMENGGLEAMVYDLLELDISGVNLRRFEQTAGLFEQKLHSMTTLQKYWYDRLLDGSLLTTHGLKLLTQYDPNEKAYNFAPAGFGGDEGIVADHQYDDYLAFAESLNDRYPLSPSQFGIALKKMCEKLKKIRSRKYGDRVAIRIFPSLEECRKEFEDLVKYEIDWE